MSHHHRRAVWIALLGFVGVAAGCTASADPAGAAVELIEGELSEQIELGPLAGDCAELDEVAQGDEFACTGVTEGGAIINFTAVFESGDMVFLYPTNLVVESSLFEVDAAAALGPEFGNEVNDIRVRDDLDQSFDESLSPKLEGVQMPRQRVLSL
nr:hypothetical protein [Ilumatobacter sp.]